MRRAVIDVGTNSVKLLVAEVAERQVRPVLEQSKQSRLGQGFYAEHILQPGPISQTAEAVADFTAKARELGVQIVRLVATSAARDAKNQHDLVSAVEKACGLRLRILSGEQEAQYGFKGVTTDPELRKQCVFLLDVGGGSAEFILGRGEQMHFASSFNVGTVRLLEQLDLGDPARPEQLQQCRSTVAALLKDEIGPAVRPALEQEHGTGPSPRIVQFVGVGGTASILGCMEAGLDHFDREMLEATHLSLDRVRWHVENLWTLPLTERKKILGLPANRADVILTGTVIYEAVMSFFKFQQLKVSTRGLRFALVLEPD